MAAWCGLHRAIQDLNAQNIWLEGDSITVISWLKKLDYDTRIQSPILDDDIRQWKKGRNISFLHTYREENQAADFLANCAFLKREML